MENTLIFLVEDDEVYSFMLDTKLKEISNFDLKTYTTGEACLDNLFLDPYIIVLDYSLPGIDGLQTLKKIKSSGSSAEVIFLSGNDDAELIRDCMDSGAYEYIVKDKDVAIKVFRSVNSIINRETEEETTSGGGGFLGGLFRRKKK